MIRKPQRIHKEYFKPTAHFCETGDNPPHYYDDKAKREQQGFDRTFPIRCFVLPEIIDQYNCRDTQKVEQVYTDR